ncbi:protein ERGIC-53-like isoform X2 [Dreissena polymorpha]|uniref:protein ERGIC-53-like isoform X2 n=1 Tax=Dreissena polymorpha TaxID=45954 RepID=UPI00226489DF|nr:protein ERGIC-53-like isoform X2 [Dreissena polymorpha]
MKVCVFLLFSAIICVNAELPKIRFEYKYSFKGPHIVQKDRSVPFWEYQGDAIASDDNIRITPSLRSKKGSVWTKSAANFENWSVEVVFKVTGRGRVGADGLAVWFTEMKGIEGPVFGSNDYWKGLAVFFDSFDNDGQAGSDPSRGIHNNPYIMAMVNDGTKQYEHQNDGINQQLGGCMRDFRNKPFPIRAKIEYYQHVLTVFFNSGLTNNKDDFELCLRAENVILPKSGYFGVSAATGGLADDHDVLAFLTHSLVPPGQKVESRIDETEKAKFDKEFDQYYEQLEKQKKEYQQQHPDKQEHFENPENAYENQADRELRMIFEGQNFIHQTLKELGKRFDELLGRQELVLSRVSQMSQGGVAVPQGGAQQGGAVPMIDTIKRHEVDRVLNTQNELIQEARQIRNIVNDVQQRANIIQNSMGQGGQQVQHGGGAGGGVNPQMALVMHELQENLRLVKTDVAHMLNRPQGAGGCPLPPPCLSSSVFFVAIAIQLAILIGYMVYRQNKENQAKKFF